MSQVFVVTVPIMATVEVELDNPGMFRNGEERMRNALQVAIRALKIDREEDRMQPDPYGRVVARAMARTSEPVVAERQP